MSTQIFQAIAAVMEDVQGVAKKDRNAAQGFNFRGIDAVVNAVGPALRKHKVIVYPKVEESQHETIEVGSKRTLMGHVVLRVRYVFAAQDGSTIEAVVVGEAMDSGDKAFSKAMSVAFRTALLQTLALPTDEPDPDASSYERSERKPPASDEEFAAVKAVMESVTQLDELAEAAKHVSDHEFSAKQKAALRALYKQRHAELTKEEAQ